MDPYFQQFGYGNECFDDVPGQVKHICRECGSPYHAAATCHLFQRTARFSPEPQYAQIQQQDLHVTAPSTYIHDWSNYSTQYHQPQYISEQYEYSNILEQQHQSDVPNHFQHVNPSFQQPNASFQPQDHFQQQNSLLHHSNHQFHQPFVQPGAFQPSQQFNHQGMHQFQQNYFPYSSTTLEQQTPSYSNSSNNSKLEEMMQQLLQQQQHQLRTNTTLQNCQMLLDQIESSLNQMLAQRSNAPPSDDDIYEEMDCSAHDRLDIGSKALQDSSRFLCDDVVVVNDFSSEGKILIDSVETTGFDVADDVSVGGCSLEASSLESPFDVSVGDCMEAMPQESLRFIIESIELEQEPSSVEEEIVVEPHNQQLGPICDHSSFCHASGTSYSSMVSIHAHHFKNIIEIPILDFIGCDSFLYTCPTQVDIVISALSYPTYVWEMGSFFGLADFYRTIYCTLSFQLQSSTIVLQKASTTTIIEISAWMLQLNHLRPPGNTSEETMEGVALDSPMTTLFISWVLQMNRLRPPEKPSKEVTIFEEATQDCHDHRIRVLTSPRYIPSSAWILLLNCLQQSR